MAQELKGEGTPSKGTLQSYLQNFTKEAIDQIVDTMRNSRNENLRFGAAKVIIDKSIADVKAVEIGGINGEPIIVKLISAADFALSETGEPASSSTTGAAYGQGAVQGIGLAQTGPEDNNSNQSNSEVGTA